VGDIIQAVNRKPANNVADFMKALEKANGNDSLLLLTQRGANSLFVAVTPK